MSSPESDSKAVEYDDEEQIYQWIYDMNTTNDKEEKEKVQIPSSSGHTPLHLKIHAERRTSAVVGNTNGLDMDDLDNLQGIPVLNVNAEEKPWRKAGADISDYFNYGFDEESWSTYCKKQSKLRAASRKLYTKIMVQKGHTRYEENQLCSAYPPSGSSSILASRQSSAATDFTGGRPGTSGRVDGCQRGEVNNTQVLTEIFPEEDRMTSYHLSPTSDINSLFAFAPSPLLPHRPGAPPLSPFATLDSGHLKGFDDLSALSTASLYPCSSGVSCFIPRSTVSNAGVIDAAKAWECYILQEKCDKDRDRSREYGHVKDVQRGRDRDRASCSFSHNSGEERMRHRDTMERGHKHHSFKSFSGEKEEQHQERRNRDNSEGWQKPSCSSSSRGYGGEDRDSQSRHKRKKPKRNKKEKETNRTCSADQERKLKSD